MKRIGFNIIHATNAEWMQRTVPLRTRQLGFNTTTNEYRKGDGTSLWVDLATASLFDVADVSVRVATSANITIATALNNGDTLDGVTLATGDLVLVRAQSTGHQNGIYVVGTTPARATGYTTFDAHCGLIVAVEEGSLSTHVYEGTSVAGGTLGTTTIYWTRTGLNALDLDDVGALNVLPSVTPLLATDLILIQRADGTLATVTAAVLKTYTTS